MAFSYRKVIVYCVSVLIFRNNPFLWNIAE